MADALSAAERDVPSQALASRYLPKRLLPAPMYSAVPIQAAVEQPTANKPEALNPVNRVVGSGPLTRGGSRGLEGLTGGVAAGSLKVWMAGAS